MSQDTRFARLQQVQQTAYQLAPAIREMFDRAGFTPADLKTVGDLSRLPVLKKESLVDLQQQRPPFGGFLAAKDEDIARIFVSPGPINEPQLRHDSDGHGFGTAFAAAGLGPGDRVLNTWSYHLVPAGLLLDEGLRAAGATVIPAGTGHWFTKIEDHIDYLMIRIDPDKVTPLKGEAQSVEYLSKPAVR